MPGRVPDNSEFDTFPDTELKRGKVVHTVDGVEGQFQDRKIDGKLLVRRGKELLEVDQADILPDKT